MKSSKQNVNVSMKRIGILSLMVLSLGVGTVRGADEFKLWHETAVGSTEPGKALEHLKSKEDKGHVEQWLVKDLDSLDISKTEDHAKALASFEKFVKEFKNEPFKFVEALKLAKEKAGDEKFSKIHDFIKLGFHSLDAKAFGGKAEKEAFERLFNNFSDLKKIDEDLLKNVFDKKSLLSALDLTDKDPNAKPSVTPSPEAKPTVTPSPVVTPVAPQPPVGEIIDDEALKRQAQQICDKLNARNDDAFKGIKDQFSSLKDSLNDALNKLAETSAAADPSHVKKNKNEKGLEDILPALLANALKKDEPQEVTPSSNSGSAVPAPQQARRDREEPNQFNQPLPEQGQVPQMPQIPAYQPTQANNFGPIRLDLPSMSGRVELRDAQDALGEIQMRQPVATSLGVNAGLPELVMAKAKVAALTRKAQGALMNGKDRLARLDEQLEELKDGGRAALPESAKRKMSELERAVTEAKNQAQYQQQVAGMLPAEQRQGAMGEIMAAQQRVQAAEGALNQFKSEVDMAIESGNSKIKALAKVRDNLQSTVSKLESEVGGLKEEEASVQTLINTNMQMQMSAMQPMQAGTPNVNRLTGFGNGGTTPRTQAPRLGGALQTAATGGDVRGSLGAKTK